MARQFSIQNLGRDKFILCGYPKTPTAERVFLDTLSLFVGKNAVLIPDYKPTRGKKKATVDGDGNPIVPALLNRVGEQRAVALGSFSVNDEGILCMNAEDGTVEEVCPLECFDFMTADMGEGEVVLCFNDRKEVLRFRAGS